MFDDFGFFRPNCFNMMKNDKKLKLSERVKLSCFLGKNFMKKLSGLTQKFIDEKLERPCNAIAESGPF